MTIPFNVPDVKPLYFDTSRVQANGFHERLKTLLSVLQSREDNAIRQRQLRNEELAKIEQAKAGDLLSQMVTQMDTTQVPGMSIPTGLPGGAGPSIDLAGQTIEGPLAKALRNQPGSAVYEALGRGSNLVTQYFNDRDKRLAARPALAAAKKPDPGQLTDAQGYALSWDKTTNKAVHITDEAGNPVRLRVPGEDGTGTGTGTWTLSGYMKNGVLQEYNSKTGQFRDAPAGRDLYPAGPPTEKQVNAAALYAESADAWQGLREVGFAPIPRDFEKFVLAARDALGENGEFTSYLAQNSVYPEETKQALRSYITLVMNALYQKSGAAISIKEMMQILPNMVFESDGPENRARKLRKFRTNIESQYRIGAPVLYRGKVEQGIDYVKPYDLFNNLPNTDPQSGQDLIPGDPYQSGGAATKPFYMLPRKP